MSKKENTDRLRNYKFIKTIGEGTFGKVKLSIHLLTNEYVAIKILEKSRITDKEELERIEKEIKYLKLFNHPNIIQIYEVIEDEKNFYIVMEFVPCGELFNYIVKKERLKEKEASFFYSQIIHGLSEINKKKICHRDIKPENLLLDEKKIIKIIDFGLSNEYIDILDTQCGSPCYAAPEIIRGIKYNGLMVDLWASGIILFAMLFGFLPFDDKDNNILFRKILECNLMFPKDIEVSQDAKDLISKILVPNPNKRIKLDEIINHPFLKYGNIEYNKIIKPEKFNKDGIIINYMVNILNYSNVNNSIYKLVKSNKHDGCTTTYKLLKKQIIENRFNYDLYNEKMKRILPYISPIKNIKVKLNNFTNEEKIYNKIKNKRKKTNQNNNINNINIINKKMLYISNNTYNKDINKKREQVNLRNKTNSTDKMKEPIKTDDLRIRKKNKLNNNVDIYDLKRLNNNNLIKKSLKMNLLFNKKIFKKNRNNLKKHIDTSISVDNHHQRKYHKKAVSITPIKKKLNYILFKIGSLEEKKLIYYPNNLLISKREKSDDKVNKNISYRYTNNQIFNNKLKKQKNGYSLSPLYQLKNIKYKTLSLDKETKIKNKCRKNKKIINRYIIPSDNNKKNEKQNLNFNTNICDSVIRQKSPFFMNITDYNNNNKYNNNSTKKKLINNERIIDKSNRENKNDHKYYKINNKYNTIQSNKRENNNINPIYINTNYIYNYQINNEYRNNGIKKRINKDKKINKKENKNLYNPKYIPLNIRDKHQLKESKDISNFTERLRTINTLDENSLYNKSKINQRRRNEIKTFFIGNINLNPGIKEYK